MRLEREHRAERAKLQRQIDELTTLAAMECATDAIDETNTDAADKTITVDPRERLRATADLRHHDRGHHGLVYGPLLRDALAREDDSNTNSDDDSEGSIP